MHLSLRLALTLTATAHVFWCRINLQMAETKMFDINDGVGAGNKGVFKGGFLASNVLFRSLFFGLDSTLAKQVNSFGLLKVLKTW